eukprot:7288606-Pyramimonas_sp.AAC.1
MPTLMPYSKGYDNKKALIYTPGYPQAEPQGAAPCIGIARPSQGVNTAETLSRNYTYVYLDLGYIYVPVVMKGGFVRTTYRHHIAIAYLAATGECWKDK